MMTLFDFQALLRLEQQAVEDKLCYEIVGGYTPQQNYKILLLGQNSGEVFLSTKDKLSTTIYDVLAQYKRHRRKNHANKTS